MNHLTLKDKALADFLRGVREANDEECEKLARQLVTLSLILKWSSVLYPGSSMVN